MSQNGRKIAKMLHNAAKKYDWEQHPQSGVSYRAAVAAKNLECKEINLRIESFPRIKSVFLFYML